MNIKHWLLLSRLPFLSIVILPYILGAVLAHRAGYYFNGVIFWLGLAGTILIQLATHYSGEINDLPEDRLSITLEKNFFTGGSQVLVEKLIPVKKVKALAYGVIFLALVIGLVLQFYYLTGTWSLFLGFTGVICGFFYSQRPGRWVSRGLGEIFIVYGFGWLAVNSGFYLQSAHFNLLAGLVSLPIGLAAANIILVNEYPDFPADKETGKFNLLVRLGKEKGAKVYALLAVLSGAMFLLSLYFGLPFKTLYFYLPVWFLSLGLAHLMLRQAYADRKKLERICALTILVNLSTTLACIFGLIF